MVCFSSSPKEKGREILHGLFPVQYGPENKKAVEVSGSFSTAFVFLYPNFYRQTPPCFEACHHQFIVNTNAFRFMIVVKFLFRYGN